MDNMEFIARMSQVFQHLDELVHNPVEIQKLKDAGKSEDFIKGCHAMFHATNTLIAPLMKALVLKAVLLDGIKKDKQAKATAETVSKLEATDEQVQNPEDISEGVKAFLERFKGPMQ